MYDKFVRDRITQLRLKKGVSEYQMSYDLGHSRGYINNISYVLPSESEILDLVNEYYTPYTEKITRLNLAEVPVEEVSVSAQQSAVTDAEDDSTEPDDAEDTETQVPGWISGSGSDGELRGQGRK